MTGIVDVGGGMRCIYSAGIYDCFMDKHIKIDYCLGVSAGSANLISYVCGQRGRNLEFYSEYALRKEYMSAGNFVRTGSYIGLDYIFSDLCNEGGEYPLDYDYFQKSHIIYKAAATRASDGKGIFFTKDDVSLNNYDILKASCSIPMVCKPYKIADEEYYDGGIAEPIPVEKAFEDGCDKVILVLTKPREEYTTPKKPITAASKLLKSYPAMCEQMKTLHLRCAEILEKIEQYEKEGKVFVFEPKNCFGVDTLTRDKYSILKLYSGGYADALRAVDNKSFFETESQSA
ncbi:MAG: patatin family protein [Acutalibacteraceae bacterium]